MLTLHFIYLMFCHWVGDFVLQSRYMAENKSRQWIPLLTHVLVYTLVLLVLLLPLVETKFYLYQFVVFNGLLHLFVDSITSKISANFWQKGNTWAFFVTVGFDQFLHAACLLFTGSLLWK